MIDVVKKVVLQLGKKKVELTLEEAKKLYEELSALFETKMVPQWTGLDSALPTPVPYYGTLTVESRVENPDRYNFISHDN